MAHKLLQTETEYRNWAWGIYQHWLNHKNGDFVSSSLDVARELGLSPVFECWDTIRDENGELVDVDENGNVIPDDTAETVALQDWMSEVSFPAVAVYQFEKFRDRLGLFEGYFCDFVSLNEFTPT